MSKAGIKWDGEREGVQSNVYVIPFTPLRAGLSSISVVPLSFCSFCLVVTTVLYRPWYLDAIFVFKSVIYLICLVSFNDPACQSRLPWLVKSTSISWKQFLRQLRYFHSIRHLLTLLSLQLSMEGGIAFHRVFSVNIWHCTSMFFNCLHNFKHFRMPIRVTVCY